MDKLDKVRSPRAFNRTNEEFDPGSGRTLAARLTHASRTEFVGLILREIDSKLSGGRVSNT